MTSVRALGKGCLASSPHCQSCLSFRAQVLEAVRESCVAPTPEQLEEGKAEPLGVHSMWDAPSGGVGGLGLGGACEGTREKCGARRFPK